MIVSFALKLVGLHPTRPLAPREGGWRFYLCSQNRDKQREVVQEKLKAYFPDTIIPKRADGTWDIYSTRDTYDYMELIDPRMVKKYGKKAPKRNLHGARIYFRTYDSGVQAFEGGSIDAAFCDEEPAEKNIYEAIKARLLDRKRFGNGWFECAMTPDPYKGLTWTFEEIVEKDGEDPDRFLLVMSMHDNKENLGAQEVLKLEASYDEDTRKARIYGMHVAREGYVLKDFKPVGFPHGNILDSFSPDWTLFTPYEATDWGFKHPWHWGFYAVNREGEIFKYYEIHQSGLKVPEMKSLVYKVRQRFGYKEPYMCWGDPSMARTESSAYSVFDQLALGLYEEDEVPDAQLVWVGEGFAPENRHDKGYIRYGITVQPADNDRDKGWITLNGRMKFEPGCGRPNWFYTHNCTMSIKEAKTLTWPPESDIRIHKAQEIARKKKDDAPDADRYLSNADPVFIPDYSPNLRLDEENTSRFRRFDDEDDDYDSTTGY